MSDTMSSAAAPAPEAAASEPADQPAQAEDNSEQPVEKAAKPKAKPPTYRKFKVGDEEVALTDADIERDYKKWRGADAKFREASQAKQSVEAFMQQFQEDPEAVLNDKRLPIDRYRVAMKWLEEHIEGQLAELNPVDPRDAKLSEAEQKLKAYQEREEAEKKAQADAEYAEALEQRKTAIGNTLHQAMQATPLSKHPESAAATLREMAMLMRIAKEQGHEVTADELVEHVHNNRFNQLYTLAHQFEGDELIEFLGPEVLKRIRNADLARHHAARDKGQQHRADPHGGSRASSPKKAQRMDPFEARQHAKKVLLGK